jgi:SAM-dependent methyltransferase
MDLTTTILPGKKGAAENPHAVFEELYLRVRKKENRIYSDDEVLHLPDISPGHPNYKEWQLRKRTSHQLTRYLTSKSRQPDILEIGCGNGWFSAKLAGMTTGLVTGIDVNRAELEQAKRVFSGIQNLEFLPGDLQDEMSGAHQSDIIVFAASIQYFSSLNNILNAALNRLKPGGEIHIIDSPFYKHAGIASAQQRSAAYYEAIGFPEMRKHYFHHCIDDLQPFNFTILYNPDLLIHRIQKNKNPHYWIRINQDKPAC